MRDRLHLLVVAFNRLQHFLHLLRRVKEVCNQLSVHFKLGLLRDRLIEVDANVIAAGELLKLLVSKRRRKVPIGTQSVGQAF